MKKTEDHAERPGDTLAAVCGLYCEACALFIATREDPVRLKGMAARFNVSEDAVKCYGCRSDKRGPYCQTCKMYACAAERGIDFCVECKEYPCTDLKQFQSERPHRIELWDDLEQIRAIGYERWLDHVRTKYTCPQCQTINSAYDLKCRKCCHEPSCDYVSKHREAIEQVLQHM